MQQEKRYMSWPQRSPIESLVIEPGEKGKYVIKMKASQGVKDGQFLPLLAEMQRAGFAHMYPDIDGEDSVLVVPEVENPDILLQLLAAQHAIYGERSESTEPLPAVTQRRNPLKWAGRLSMAGFAGHWFNGMAQSENYRIFGMPILLAGLTFLSVYGEKGALNTQKIVRQAGDYLKERGVDLPELAEDKQTTLQAVNEFCEENAIPITYAIGVPGTTAMVLSGMRDKSFGRSMVGVTSLLGCLVILAVPERKKRPDEKPTSLAEGIASVPGGIVDGILHPREAPGKLLDFIKESPMRFNAIVNLLPDNIFLAFDSMQQLRGVKKDWKEKNAKEIGHLTKEIKKMQRSPEKIADMTGQQFSRSLSQQERMYKLLNKGKYLSTQHELALSVLGQKGVVYLTAATSLCFLISGILVGLSSKNRHAEDVKPEKYHQLYSITAQHLLPLPEDQRELALKNMVGFYANHNDVQDGAIGAETIESEIRKRLDIMQHSPWLASNDNMMQQQQGTKAEIGL